MAKLERKGWNWAAVPSDVILSDLTDSAARIYSYLVWRAGTSGSAFPKVETIAKDTHRSDPTVKRALKELVSKNWVYRYRRVGGSSMTFIFERQEDCIEFKNGTANVSKMTPRRVKNDTTEVSQVIRVNESHFNESHLNKTNTTAAAKKVEHKPDPVITCYETNIGAATSIILDAIETERKRHQNPNDADKWMLEAISEAVTNNVRKWAYVEAILRGWHTNGYKVNPVKENKYPQRRDYNIPVTPSPLPIPETGVTPEQLARTRAKLKELKPFGATA